MRRERDTRGLFSLLQSYSSARRGHRTQWLSARYKNRAHQKLEQAAAWAGTFGFCTNKKMFICVLSWGCCFVRLPLLTHTFTGSQSPKMWNVKKNCRRCFKRSKEASNPENEDPINTRGLEVDTFFIKGFQYHPWRNSLTHGGFCPEVEALLCHS